VFCSLYSNPRKFARELRIQNPEYRIQNTDRPSRPRDAQGARNPESRIQNPEYRWCPDPHGSPKMCVTEPRELGIQNPESRIQNTDGAPTHMVLLRCVSLSQRELGIQNPESRIQNTDGAPE
jgi:hypothetical protein